MRHSIANPANYLNFLLNSIFFQAEVVEFLINAGVHALVAAGPTDTVF